MPTLEKSNRVLALRNSLIDAIPRFPNNRDTLQALKAKPVQDLLITYIGWRLRFVAARPRKVVGSSNIAGDPRAATLAPNIDAFLKAVEEGNDLTPYLSLKVRKRGYTPAADLATPNANSWEDKDFLLNVMGLHHFHLGLTQETGGHMERADVILFASITRTEFEIIGLFDHDAFESSEDGTMNEERGKLWNTYLERAQKQLLPGKLSIGGFGGLGIALSSQPIAVVFAAQEHVRILRDQDPKLDDPIYVRSLYEQGQVPKKPKWEWTYSHLDFGICDRRASVCGVFSYGPN